MVARQKKRQSKKKKDSLVQQMVSGRLNIHKQSNEIRKKLKSRSPRDNCMALFISGLSLRVKKWKFIKRCTDNQNTVHTHIMKC